MATYCRDKLSGYLRECSEGEKVKDVTEVVFAYEMLRKVRN